MKRTMIETHKTFDPSKLWAAPSTIFFAGELAAAMTLAKLRQVLKVKPKVAVVQGKCADRVNTTKENG
jgi:hypothetical protein